ncbi:MAG: hypothetical protein EZS28_026101 [Streblomastix strix]|uniref:USP domain-containing protein n=1 Tax=Streblomastix strix TaxID=222440 RepID=A0A5J4V7G5_9EUKA|nr:MAG: hypothetical protein EZS28_026101 [Streblomastix strix]
MHRQFRDSVLSWDGIFWGEQKKPQTTTDIQPSIRLQRPAINPNGQRVVLPEEKLEKDQIQRAKADAVQDANARNANQGTFEELKKLFVVLQNGLNKSGLSGQDNQVPTLTGFLDKYRDFAGMQIDEDEQQDVNLFLINLFDNLEVHLDCLEMHNFIRRYFRCFLSEQQICANGHLQNNAQRQKVIPIRLSGASNLYSSLGSLVRGEYAQGSACSECKEKRLGNNPLIKRTLLQTLPNTIIFNIARVQYSVEEQRAVKDKSLFTFPFGLNQKNRKEQRGLETDNEEDLLDDILDLTPFTREAVLKNEAAVNSNEERYKLIQNNINEYKPNERNESDIRSYPVKSASYDNMGRGEQYYKFRLVGVVVHSGEARGGHYYSYIRERNPPYRWIKYDDEKTYYVMFKNEQNEQEKDKKKEKVKEKEKEKQKQRVDKNIILVDNESESEEDETLINNMNQLNDQNESQSDYEESDVQAEDQIGSDHSSQQDQDIQGFIPIFSSQYSMMEEECFGGSRPSDQLDEDLKAQLMTQTIGRNMMGDMLKRDRTACLLIYERINPIDDWAYELVLIASRLDY